MKKIIYLLFAGAMICGCATKNAMDPGADPSESGYMDDVWSGDSEEGGGKGSDGGASGEGEGGEAGEGQTHAGTVTAAEWRDLDNWLFWSDLMTNTQTDQEWNNYSAYSGYWGFYTNNRVAVRVLNGDGVPQRDVPVQLSAGSTTLYQGRTDNRGEANLFIGLTQKQETVDASSLVLTVNGAAQQAAVAVTSWGEETQWNICTASVTASKDIDIAFIVDATGSMIDEIDFLKDDLRDIITKAGNGHSDATIRTAALFYRDEGDEYVTRVSDFTTNLSTTASFINNQQADGGGDYPEAVHTALERGLQDLSWKEGGNCIRLAFMLLDAPPHHESQSLSVLHQTIPQYAQHGIRIIPVAASGIDKPTEFFLRFAAIATDGTYVFITNDSGVGGDHIQASVGDYEVELLNDLMVRLINRYLE